MMVKTTKSVTPFALFIGENRASLSTLFFFTVMMTCFLIANPKVFTNPIIYNAVFVTLPVAIFLVVPLVFTVTGGEIDLSFPSNMAMSSWIFSLAIQKGLPPILGLILAVVVGMAIGAVIGTIVVYGNLSSLVCTLGFNFLLRGFIMIFTEGRSITILGLQDSLFHNALAGTFLGLPVQTMWVLLFTIFFAFVFNQHSYGAWVHCVGDNPESAAQMGIDVKRVRISFFILVGLGSALAGVFSVLVNFSWWPTTGDGYLLTALASVFVGGTPTWGGVGTVVGGALGAIIVSFMETGVVAAGLTGFYIQFFKGLLIILSLLAHRYSTKRYR
ncbi:TPA: ABC transporter permease [Candidatus Poribacteria bacterium]|nr:ABC transporter permease [Candidatus Poribacteria bacterium]